MMNVLSIDFNSVIDSVKRLTVEPPLRTPDRARQSSNEAGSTMAGTVPTNAGQEKEVDASPPASLSFPLEVFPAEIREIISAKETLTLEEAAAFLGIKRSTLYKMTHEQIIPFYKPNGKLVYFEKTDLLDWIRRNRVSSDAEITEAARIHMKILSQRK